MTVRNDKDRYPHGKEVYFAVWSVVMANFGVAIPLPIIPFYFEIGLGSVVNIGISIALTGLYFGICWILLRKSEQSRQERLDRYYGVIIEINAENTLSKWEKILPIAVFFLAVINAITSEFPNNVIVLQMFVDAPGEIAHGISYIASIWSVICTMSWFRERAKRIARA